MKNVDKACICSTKDSQIKFEENKRKIIFLNPSNHRYKKVKVDGCAIKTGQKCDDLLISQDEHEEHFVESKHCTIFTIGYKVLFISCPKTESGVY